MITYRDYEIERSGAPQFPYEFAHKDFDGPEDKRIGNARTEEDAKRQIDEQIEDSESRTALPNKPMKPNHTPGPWTVDECPDANGNLTIRQADGGPNGNTEYGPIGCAYSLRGDDSSIEQIANALLIAASPDLLKAAISCQFMADKCNNAMLPDSVQELLKAIETTLSNAIKNALPE